MSGPVLLTHSFPLPPSMHMMPASCPNCGSHVDGPEEAHRRIEELESQVRILNTKAAAAVDKLADYEDEVRTLRAQCAQLQQQQQQQPQSQPFARPQSPLQSSVHSSPPRGPSRLASLSSFLPGRKRDTAGGLNTLPSPAVTSPFNHSTPNLISPRQYSDSELPTNSSVLASQQEQLTVVTTHLQSLQSSLENERTLRMRAESSLTQTQTEIEELTAQLFGQANEMVAEERKARHKLEERVKQLETRDVEKRRRLDRLESALQRIERVRGLVEKNSAMSTVNATEIRIVVDDEKMRKDEGLVGS